MYKVVIKDIGNGGWLQRLLGRTIAAMTVDTVNLGKIAWAANNPDDPQQMMRQEYLNSTQTKAN